jgi:FtsZ-binding cell division protein ZapB
LTELDRSPAFLTKFGQQLSVTCIDTQRFLQLYIPEYINRRQLWLNLYVQDHRDNGNADTREQQQVKKQTGKVT